MEDHSNIYAQFQALLAKWRAGTITAVEQQQLEQWASSDPFLADAWEGFQVKSKENPEEAIARLKARVSQKTEVKSSKRRSLIWLPRAAAAVIILGLGSWFLWPHSKVSINEEMAEAVQIERITDDVLEEENGHEEKDLASSDQGESTSDNIEPNVLIDKNVQKETPVSKKRKATQSTPKAIAASPKDEAVSLAVQSDTKVEGSRDSATAYYVDGIQVQNDLSKIAPTPVEMKNDSNRSVPPDSILNEKTETTSIASTANDQDTLAEDYIAAGTVGQIDDIQLVDSSETSAADGEIVDAFEEEIKAGMKNLEADTTAITYPEDTTSDKLEIAANMMSPIQASKTIVGIVKGQGGEPLIGANIYQIGTKIGTSTDIEGRFTLTLSNQSNPLNIDYIGYESQQLSQDNFGKYVEVVLDEGSQILDEVVVTEYNKKAARAKTQDTGFAGKISPVNGDKSFLRNLKKNIEIDHSIDTSLHGQIKLNIRIDNKGNPLTAEVISAFNESLADKIIAAILKNSKWKTKPAKMGGRFEYVINWK